MKHFIQMTAIKEDPSPTHFHPNILPELESLYAALLPKLAQTSPFIYLGSTARGEGSSTIAWALAYYLAMREEKDCLFVDGDVSNPFIRHHQDLPEAGLSDYMQAAADFRLLPFPTELNHLSAIHSGRIRSRYVRLSQDQADAFVEEAKRYYRAIVFNSRPGYDKYTELWARASDAVIIATQYRSTKRQVLDRILSGFTQGGVKVTGLLLNKREYPIPGPLYRRL